VRPTYLKKKSGQREPRAGFQKRRVCLSNCKMLVCRWKSRCPGRADKLITSQLSSSLRHGMHVSGDWGLPSGQYISYFRQLLRPCQQLASENHSARRGRGKKERDSVFCVMLLVRPVLLQLMHSVFGRHAESFRPMYFGHHRLFTVQYSENESVVYIINRCWCPSLHFRWLFTLGYLFKNVYQTAD
jgi:hypothetical protein